MTESNFEKTLWSYASFLLWMVFFALGFLAEESYDLFRLAGRVVPQYAMVNSPYVITLAFSGYLAYFTYQRCRELGQNAIDAQGRALQIFVVGLLAFLTVTIENVRQAADFPSAYAYFRNVIYFAFTCKSLCCLYLIALMARYYLFGREEAFARLISIFPSMRYQDGSDANSRPTDGAPKAPEIRSDVLSPIPESTVAAGMADQATNENTGR